MHAICDNRNKLYGGTVPTVRNRNQCENKNPTREPKLKFPPCEDRLLAIEDGTKSRNSRGRPEPSERSVRSSQALRETVRQNFRRPSQNAPAPFSRFGLLRPQTGRFCGAPAREGSAQRWLVICFENCVGYLRSPCPAGPSSCRVRSGAPSRHQALHLTRLR